jgi:hypothetical protein
MINQLNMGLVNPRTKKAHEGELPDGPCPVCRTKLDGGWGRAARGIMWKTKRRRKATAKKTKLVKAIPRPSSPDSDIELIEGDSKSTSKGQDEEEELELEGQLLGRKDSDIELIQRNSQGQIIEAA